VPGEQGGELRGGAVAVLDAGAGGELSDAGVVCVGTRDDRGHCGVQGAQERLAEDERLERGERAEVGRVGGQCVLDALVQRGPPFEAAIGLGRSVRPGQGEDPGVYGDRGAGGVGDLVQELPGILGEQLGVCFQVGV
jgi:hypothetical protein